MTTIDTTGIPRRTFLLGGLAAAGAAATAAAAPRMTVMSSSGAAVPVDAAAAVAREALSYAGAHLAGSPWEGAARVSGWAAAFTAWLLRNQGAPATVTSAELHAHLLTAGTPTTEPQRGDVIFYNRGGITEPHHVGLVSDVADGIPQTVEGDVPGTFNNQFVRRYGAPWSDNVTYIRPTY